MVTDIYFLNPTENMLCKIENYLRKSEYEEENINDSTCRFRMCVKVGIRSVNILQLYVPASIMKCCVNYYASVRNAVQNM